MRRRAYGTWRWHVWLAVLVALTAGAARAEDAEKELRGRLQERVNLDYDNQPLGDVLKALAKQLQVQVHIQWNWIEDEGGTREAPVTIRLQGVRASTALELVLQSVENSDLTYVLRDNVIVITTQSQAENSWRPQIYDVRDLLNDSAPQQAAAGPTQGPGGLAGGMMPGVGLGGMPSGAMSAGPAEELVAFLTTAVAPRSWMKEGGSGQIAHYRGFLVVRNDPWVLEEIGKLLEAMREARSLSTRVPDTAQLPGASSAPEPSLGAQPIPTIQRPETQVTPSDPLAPSRP